MPAEVEGTWEVLREAVGGNRKVVARQIGRPLSSFEKHLLPPPSLDRPDGNGVTNGLDIICTIIEYAERPDLILDFIAKRCGGTFVRKSK